MKSGMPVRVGSLDSLCSARRACGKLLTSTSRSLAALLVFLLVSLAAQPASAAIAADASVSKDSSASGTTIATPSFNTTSPNELLLAFVAADYKSGTNTTVKSIAGGGLTWALVKRSNAQSGTAEIWRAFLPTATTGVTVTATLSQSVAASITVMSFSGVNTSGTNGSGAIGAVGGSSAQSGVPSASLVTAGAISWVLGVGNDFDNAIARTLGSGQVLVHQYLSTLGDTYWVQRIANPAGAAGSSATINDTAPSGDRFNLSIVEVLAGGGVSSASTISGTISPAAAGFGAKVALSGAATATTTADANGNYSFSGLANGSYTITPTRSGYGFTPPSQAVTLNGANQSAINFTAAAITSSISGTISPAAAGSGANVALSGATTATTTADANGNYSFSGLANGSYAITPTRSGYSFTPPSQAVALNGSSQTAINFTGQSVVSTGIALIQKAINGNESSTSTMSVSFSAANTAGNFLIVEATIARPSGTLTVSDTLGNTYIAAGVPITDPAQSVTSYLWYVPVCRSGSNTVTVVPTVPGAQEIHISEWSGLATISPVDVSASATGTGVSASSGSATTTSAGDLIYGYTFLYNTAAAGTGFTGLTLVNGDLDEYAIQSAPGAISATFSQQSGTWFARLIAFRALNASQSSISGTLSPGSAGSGATVSLSGAGSATLTADANGNFLFPGVPDGSYTVTPTKSGFSFSPASQLVTVNGASQTGINFSAQSIAPVYTISGSITPSAGGSGAYVALSGAATASTAADANGNYSFPQLGSGNYTVTPAKNNFSFTPPAASVSIASSDVSNVDFMATAPSSSITLDTKVSQDGATASTTITSPVFSTASNNELLLAFIETDYLSGTNTTVKSVAGAGLTWTLVGRANGQSGTSEVWRAFATAPLSAISVTATLSQNVVSSMTVLGLAGVATGGTGGSGAIGAVAVNSATSGAPTAKLVTTAPGSWVLGGGNDFDNAVARSIPSSQTLLHQDLASTGDTYWVQMQSNAIAAAGTSVTINDTAPTKDRFNLVIVEVLAGGGVSNTIPPTVAVTAPVQGATVAGVTTVSASASDPVAVAGVQFLLDGASLGAELSGSPYSFAWDSTTVTDGPHSLAARARDSAGLSTISQPVAITVSNSANAAVVGQWSSVYPLPAVAVNLILLRNNKVLFYQDGASPTVWDYVANTFTSVPVNVDLFCSGNTMLADGRVMIVGGYGGSSSTIGINSAEIFDPSTNEWTTLPHMQYRRWYPTATILSDGRVLVTAGWQTTTHSNAGVSEIYDPSTNSWTSLTNANNPFETYPFLYQLPDGRVIHIGGSEYATDTDVLDLNSASWSVIDSNIVDGGSATMYQPGKFMKAGSATDSQEVGPSSNTTFVLDMTQASPAWRQTASMAYPRSFMNLTMLPDGTVLATGGETDRNGGTIANAVYPAELWSPVTQTWSTLSAMHTPREYHGTALLLPDGRVLESGMGADFGNVPDEKSAEFFSPPYLFKGPRPTITQAPAQIQPNTTFFVGTPDATSIKSVSLIRTGAVTHFFDENGRFLPLSFTQTAGGLTVTAPENTYLAPPGYYMLFIVNTNGVPSVAPFVQVP